MSTFPEHSPIQNVSLKEALPGSNKFQVLRDCSNQLSQQDYKARARDLGITLRMSKPGRRGAEAAQVVHKEWSREAAIPRVIVQNLELLPDAAPSQQTSTSGKQKKFRVGVEAYGRTRDGVSSSQRMQQAIKHISLLSRANEDASEMVSSALVKVTLPVLFDCVDWIQSSSSLFDLLDTPERCSCVAD